MPLVGFLFGYVIVKNMDYMTYDLLMPRSWVYFCICNIHALVFTPVFGKIYFIIH